MSFKTGQLRIIRTLFILFFYVITCAISQGQVLKNEKDFMQVVRHTKQKTTLSTLKNSEFLTSQMDKSRNNVALRAKQAQIENLQGAKTEISALCLNHTEILLEALVSKQQWAMRFVDAMGKPPSDLLDFHITWLGDYDECVAIAASVNKSGDIISPFNGRYCLGSFPLGPGGQATLFSPSGPALTIGVCVPNSCSGEDTAALLDTLLSLLPLNTSTLPTPTVTCQLESLDYDTKAIVVIIICSIFALVMVLATCYDIIIILWLTPQQTDLPKYEKIKEENEKIIQNGTEKHYGATNSVASAYANGHVTHTEPVDEKGKQKQQTYMYEAGTLGKVLLSFSIYTNASKILNTNQPSGTLTAVNGIRFVSMTWVVLGHSYAIGLAVGENVGTFLPAMLKRFTFQAISNATVCVDTFFTLSGLLVAYLSLKEMKKRNGARNFNWGMFYFHRFWRLTPPYMLFLMLYAPLMKYWSDGPMWPQKGVEINECEGNWWQNLLYINNLIDPEKMCMAWSWYLANDMQFYILSPLMLIPLYYSSLLGILSCGLLVLVNFISTGVISSVDGLGPTFLTGNAGEAFADTYVKPWCRIGPYVVGFLAGYILYKTDCKIKIPKFHNLICWMVATGVALLVLYGLYDSSGNPNLSNDVSALYNATNRTAWAISISWVVVACATENGGWINTLLSWKGIIPLSRLTYCAYLVHPVVMYTYFYSRRTLIYFSDIEMVWLFCGFLCVTFAAAFILSLAFESPMMGLEKVLLGRKKRS